MSFVRPCFARSQIIQSAFAANYFVARIGCIENTKIWQPRRETSQCASKDSNSCQPDKCPTPYIHPTLQRGFVFQPRGFLRWMEWARCCLMAET